jgi:hypothetical protein
MASHLDISTILLVGNILTQHQQHHDHHFPRPALAACTPWLAWITVRLRLFRQLPGRYDGRDPIARRQLLSDSIKEKAQINELQNFV